jgi:cob(I)alamin adenosyltransferase
MKIYTKRGDGGKTDLFGSSRVSKSSLHIDVLGCIDELNSILGIVGVFCPSSTGKTIKREQKNMLRLGADIATSFDAADNFQKRVDRISEEDIAVLEKEVDEWQKKLPELRNFILPGGSKASAFIHHARSVCRRCERVCFKLSEKQKVNEFALRYLNRLSDWLFTLARKLDNE